MPTQESNLEALFTLESQKTGVVEEPPFKILALGNWSGDAEKPPVGSRSTIEIDRDNFDDLIARLGVRLDLQLESGNPISLEFKELDDFHPDQIFRRLPVFSELRDLRQRLKDDSSFHAAAREAREKLAIKEAEKKEEVGGPAETVINRPPAENLLDAILTRPSGGGAAPKPGVSSEIADLVSDIVRPHLISVDEAEQSKMLTAVDEATSGLMRQILHDRRFQELEAAWRGLFFLVRRTETSSDLKILLFDATKTELSDNLKEHSSLADSVLYRHLISDSIETPGGEPFAVVLGNYALEANVDDVAMLIRLAKLSAAANAPFISHMRPDVFGVRSIADNPDPSKWRFSDENNASKLWRALCDQSEAVYLGMVIPRFLARLPYGAETDPLETFSFEEFREGPIHDQYVWANGCFAVGQLLAESFSAYGWEMGRALKQDIEGLPVHVYKDGTDTVYKPCSEVLLTDAAFQKLMEFGFMPLITFKNSDRVKLARYQSIADTELKARWR